MRLIRSAAAAVLILGGHFPAGSAAAQSVPDAGLLPWSQQIAVREGWLAKRHEMLLPMMRRHGLGMWIVVNEEFHDDPLTQYVAPPRVYTGNRDVFVFVDAGDAGLRKLALTSYSEENLRRFFESPAEPRPAAQALEELYEQYRPAKIGLGIDGGRGVQRSLTHEGGDGSGYRGTGRHTDAVAACPLRSAERRQVGGPGSGPVLAGPEGAGPAPLRTRLPGAFPNLMPTQGARSLVTNSPESVPICCGAQVSSPISRIPSSSASSSVSALKSTKPPVGDLFVPIYDAAVEIGTLISRPSVRGVAHGKTFLAQGVRFAGAPYGSAGLDTAPLTRFHEIPDLLQDFAARHTISLTSRRAAAASTQITNSPGPRRELRALRGQ